MTYEYIQHDDLPLNSISAFVKELRDSGCTCFVLVPGPVKRGDRYKQTFVERAYWISEWLVFDRPKHKIGKMMAAAKAYGIPLNECLFVGDDPNMIKKVCKAGILALHASNIVAAYDKKWEV